MILILVFWCYTLTTLTSSAVCDPIWRKNRKGNFNIDTDLCPFKLLSRAERMEPIRNKYIMMIGDSLTRYQYMNLVHYIIYDKWISDFPHLEHERDWPDWETFFKGSNLRLGCSEICDGFENSKNRSHNKENRYYYDKTYNVSVSFHAWFGGHIWIDREGTFFDRNEQNNLRKKDRCSDLNAMKKLMLGPYESTGIEHNSLTTFIQEELSFSPPDIVILNFGLWSVSEYWPDKTNMTAINLLFKAFRSAMGPEGHIVWKTTTARKGNSDELDSVEFLNKYKKIGFEIYDAMKYTKTIVNLPGAYWDAYHFTTSVYSELNIRLFDYLSTILKNETRRF